MNRPPEHRITLVRHGRPTVRYSHTPWTWRTAREMNGLLDDYDLSGLDAGWNEPRAGNPIHAYPISSDLPRALETAHLIARRPDNLEVSALFREVPVGRIPWQGLRLPTVSLLMICRLGWLTGLIPVSESRRQSRSRVRAATDVLEERVGKHGDVALFSHGFFLWLVGRELRKRGWASPRVGPYRYLERIEFSRPAPLAVPSDHREGRRLVRT
ncbi:MAG: histidine phosphatase family protein [Spirochaetales bacterium]|nr:histidine phosphatase family protein [Leptospiraceae bacterium]MCP5482614.1 histidine phosphatase family protein [Spirochaetales bacterium]MCP5485203.1 histidine phosphatase family protein [Spirochaetales bacterium]